MFLKSLVNKLRYLVWASPLVWLTLLNGCGVGTVLDPFIPTRIIAFGDAFMDVRTPRFTVNDEIPYTSNVNLTNYSNGVGPLNSPSNATTYTYQFNPLFAINGFITSVINKFAPAVIYNNPGVVDTAINPELTVIERISADYGFGAVVPMSTVSGWAIPSTSGVYSFAEGNALVMDLAGTVSGNQQSYAAGVYTGSTSPARSIQSQINLYLNNNGGTFSSSDLVVINAGTADILWNTLGTGGSVAAAAQNLVSQVGVLLSHGAKHVVVFGPPNMGRSPFASANSLKQTLTSASLTLINGAAQCTDFNCSLELGLQRLVGTVSQNPVIYVDISSQTSLITGTINTGSSNTFSSFSDPLYGIALSFPGDSNAAFEDLSSGSNAVDANYYCNQTNVGVSTSFFITSPTISGNYPFTLGGSYCYANPKTPTNAIATHNNYTAPYDYRSYAYADPIYFTPSVNRMLADFILGKLSLASWR